MNTAKVGCSWDFIFISNFKEGVFGAYHEYGCQNESNSSSRHV